MSREEQSGERRRPLFTRAADGSLRSAEDSDIGDVWAHQKRLSLQDAIAADKAKEERKERKRKRKTRSKASQTAKTSTTAQGEAKTVEININMPSLKMPHVPWSTIKTVPKNAVSRLGQLRRSVSTTIIVIFVVMFGLLGYNLFFNSSTDNRGKSDSTAGSGGGSIKSTPTFNTVLPSGKGISELGGWAKISPPGKDPVYAYVDSIQGVKINVSEQPLPKTFKEDIAGSVRNLATQFSANQSIETGDGVAYIGNSTDGVQSIVFAKDGLLILIKAASQIPDDTWADYINSLE